jgi:hypothetical protein
MTPIVSTTNRRRTAVAVLILALSLSGCSTASRSTTIPAPTAPPIVKTTPASSPPVRAGLGDLTIHLAGTCTWFQDTTKGLWINPTLAASWTGPGPFPPTAFGMTSNYGTTGAGGPINSTAAFKWAIGGQPTAGNAFLGHTVLLTVTINPGHTVPEINYTNNITVITVSVPTTPPPAKGTEETLPCN